MIRKLVAAWVAAGLLVPFVAGCGDTKTGQPVVKDPPKDAPKMQTPGGAPGGAQKKPASD
jgi:hypothetical protein